MKKYSTIIIALFGLLLFSACENTWSSEDKDQFHEACMSTAKDQGLTDDKAKQMCDCRLEKIMEKYPNVNDFMEHIADVQTDQEIQKCWDDAQ